MTSANEFYKIIDLSSPYSFLEQRLQYASSSIDNPIIFSSNTPPASIEDFNTAHLPLESLVNYAPSNGITKLIETIAQRENLKNNLQIKPAEVLVTNGALQGISLILRLLYRPNAFALCQSPVLIHIESLLNAYGYETIFFDIENQNLQFDNLPKHIKDNIQVVFINIPNNPTGKLGSRTAIKNLIDFSKKHKANLVADLVYDEFIFPGNKFFNPLTLQPDWCQTYIVNSMSKSFGVPGIRIGWVISDEINIKSLAGLLETEYIAVSSYAQEQAVYIMKQGNESLVKKIFIGLDSVENQLSIIPNIKFAKPAGGTQYFIELPVRNIEWFADFMLTEYRVVLATSGNYKALDDTYKKCIRIPIGESSRIIKHGLELLSEGLNQWSKLEAEISSTDL